MNRKFRFNVGKIGKILRIRKDEDPEEDDKLLLLKERIYAPIVWRRLASGVRIQDLKDRYYDVALEMIKKYYICNDPLCKASGMADDPVSIKSFLEMCSFQLKDTTSIMAIDESNEGMDIVAGVCLLRVVNKIDFGRIFSRTILKQGEAQEKCTELKTALNRKVDIYADYDCETFLRIYAVCLKPSYRRRGIGFDMMRTVFGVSRALQIPIIMGIFDNSNIQKCAQKLGFEVTSEIQYADWKHKNTNEPIFTDVGPGNDSCVLMVAKIKAEELPDYLKIPPPDPDADKKKGKKDKKGKKGKKDKKKGKKGKGKKK